ncbi:MAG: thiamine diphosphokinase [Acidimicrobiales bacterium]
MNIPQVVVVVAGGDAPYSSLGPRLPPSAFVIAADSGLDRARALGWPVDLVVGDLDSATEAAIGAARADGVDVEQHPAAKDQTDLELALDRAVARRPDRIVVVGGGGGRLDHLVAAALLLASARYTAVPVEAWFDGAVVTVIRGEARLHGTPGDLVSLLPLGGPARGVTTEALRYPLADEDLAPGTTRGVSNELLASEAGVRVRDGVLLAIQPGAGG